MMVPVPDTGDPEAISGRSLAQAAQRLWEEQDMGAGGRPKQGLGLALGLSPAP